MSITNLSIEQLKEVVVIKEQIVALEQKLARLTDITGGATISALDTKTPERKTRKGMTPAAKAKIAASAKARWAKIKGTVIDADDAIVKAVKKAKRNLSPEGRAKIVAALKKRWAAKKK